MLSGTEFVGIEGTGISQLQNFLQGNSRQPSF